MRRHPLLSTPLLAALAFLGLVGLAPARAATASSLPLTVTTQQGPVRGRLVPGARLFAGIRYAAPPIGRLRWRPPQSPPIHTAIADATKFGARCPQATGSYTTPEEGGAEDCLYLNIYTPTGFSGALPVMLFIHGGSFVSGTGADYIPISMVDQGKVIVVTINYRLGALGALALPALDKEEPTLKSGAYALLDQQAALAWVGANIASFGGDPSRITLFGESAGATYTCENVASPGAAGLFGSAIAESGCGLQSPSLAVSEAIGLATATALGCAPNGHPDLTCLRAATPLAITNAEILATGGVQNEEFGSAPAVGGGVLPQTVYNAFLSGQFAQVPMIIGSNRHEGRLFVYGHSAGPIPLDDAQYLADLQGFVTPNTGAPANATYAAYPPGSFVSPAEAYAAVVGDALFSCRSLKSDRLASPIVPVYAYQFTDPRAPNALGIPLGATHTSELFYLFDFPATLSAAQLALAAQMRGYWTRFAYHHVPAGPGLPPWPEYQSGLTGGPLLNLAPGAVVPTTSASFAAEHVCPFWVPYMN